MIKINRAVAAIATAILITGSTIPVQAREINTLYKVYVQHKNTEAFTSYSTKATSNLSAVVNLEEDNDKQWVVATVRNSSGASRGSASIQEGTRKTFACSGTAGYKYRLGFKRAQSSTVTMYINGSWSPDSN